MRYYLVLFAIIAPLARGLLSFCPQSDKPTTMRTDERRVVLEQFPDADVQHAGNALQVLSTQAVATDSLRQRRRPDAQPPSQILLRDPTLLAQFFYSHTKEIQSCFASKRNQYV